MASSEHGPTFHFTEHAKLAMRERRITERSVLNALANVVNEYAGTNELQGTIVKVGVGIFGRRLHVVVDAEDETRVVTVWRERYRRLRRPRRRRGSHRRKR